MTAHDIKDKRAALEIENLSYLGNEGQILMWPYDAISTGGGIAFICFCVFIKNALATRP